MFVREECFYLTHICQLAFLVQTLGKHLPWKEETNSATSWKLAVKKHLLHKKNN